MSIAEWSLLLSAFAAIAAVISVIITECGSYRRYRLQIQPNVVMFMENNNMNHIYADIVIKNFGQTPAYNIQLQFENTPRMLLENKVDISDDEIGSWSRYKAEYFLPEILPILAPGQEWRTVWGSYPMWIKI